MSKVSITVNDRAYAIGCEPGQEDQVRKLGTAFNTRVQDLVGQVGQIGDLRLFLMAALTMADELQDANDRLQSSEARARSISSSSQSSDAALAKEMADVREQATRALDDASERVEEILHALDGEV